MTVDELVAELLRVRLRHQSRVNAALDELARWLDENLGRSVEDARRSDAYANVLRAFDDEVRAMSAVLSETLPAMVESEVARR